MELKVAMTKVTVALAAAAMLTSSLAAFAGQVTKHTPKSAAHAAPKADVFHTNTNSPPPALSTPIYAPHAANQPAAQITTDKSVPTQWFEGFDNAVATHKVNSQEMIILNRQFDQQKERVIEWTNTAAKVATRYRDLARILRSMPVPPGMMAKGRTGTSVQDLRQYMADWYDDSASILEDWIRPRKPARTQEELDDILDKMHQRSEAQKNTLAQLQRMDSDLRAEYNVHPPLHEDAIQTFARKTPMSVQQERDRNTDWNRPR